MVKVDLDFRNVIRMIDYLEDDDLTHEAREWLALKCICKHPREGMLPPVMKLLFPKEKRRATRERILDYEQDAELIKAAFMQAYRIDLETEKIHWLKFCYLLSGIPEDCLLSEIINIRIKPIPAPTEYNKEQREWLIKAKAECAVKVSEKERKKRYQQDVADIASMLIAWAKE